jgi:hypothetical protein
MTVVAVAALVMVAHAATVEPKADALLRSMSDLLAKTRTFRFTTDEHHERLRRNGERVKVDFSREATVRRPDRLRFDVKSGEKSGALVYDGAKFSFVGNGKKVWAQTAVPPTIDQAIDYVGARLGVPMPMADILYSSPYDALVGEGTTGKYIGLESIAGHSCHHLSFQHEVVDYDLWVRDGEQPFPCQIELHYKLDAGAPVSRIAFKDFDLSPSVSDSTFAFTAPEGYRRIRIVARRQAAPSNAEEDAE